MVGNESDSWWEEVDIDTLFTPALEIQGLHQLGPKSLHTII